MHEVIDGQICEVWLGLKKTERLDCDSSYMTLIFYDIAILITM